MKKLIIGFALLMSMAACKKTEISFFVKHTDVFINAVAKTAVVHQIYLDGTTSRYVATDKGVNAELIKAVEAKSEKIKISINGEEIIGVDAK